MEGPLKLQAASQVDLHRHLFIFHSLWTVPSDDHHDAHREAHLRMWRPGTVDHVHDEEPSPGPEEHGFW